MPTPDQHNSVADSIDTEMEKIEGHSAKGQSHLADKLDALIIFVTKGFYWLIAVLIVIILTQVLLRYGFSGGLIFFEEMQWHLYAVGILMGISYAQVHDSHIRVDILHASFSSRTKEIVEILGILFLALPFVSVVFYHSLDFVSDSWRVGETSDAPLGLPYRWIIKSFIPVGFSFLGLSLISRLVRGISQLSRSNSGQEI